MSKYQLTNKAVDDLSNIWEYTIETWSENQADNYYHFLLNTFQELSENPKLGKNYNEIKSDLFGHLPNKHIVFYQVISNSEILIVRILHGSMDLKNRVND